MKVVVVSGERQVSISLKGSSPKLLREVEATAARLLALGPEPPKPLPVGFTLISETALATEEE